MNYNLCVESMPETDYDPDYGTPGMPENLACRPCQRVWHAGHAREFGMPEILLGMNYLLLEPRLLAA